MISLKNKTVLLAGCGGLLGSKIASRLLNEGANVIGFDIDISSVKSKLEILSPKLSELNLELYQIDITDENQVLKLFKKLSGKIIDGAINATYPRNGSYGKSFFDVSLENFNENTSLHLGSSFLFMRECSKLFINSNKSVERSFSLVNIASIYGCVAPKFEIYEGTSMTMPIEYAAIKSAIIHLSKYVSSYVKDSKFRVNSVSPGGLYDSQPTSFVDSYKEKTNGTGMLEVEDIIGTVLFLISDDSIFITGQNIVVDDGFVL